MPRKTSVYAPRDPAQPKKKFDLQDSLHRSQTMAVRDSVYPVVSAQRCPNPSEESESRAAEDRSSSTSAQTILTTRSKTQIRPQLPDFGPAPRIASTTAHRLGLPKSSSMSSSLSMKKQSQADMLRKARPVPAPPADFGRRPLLSAASSLARSSTLHAPTAASLARMQATIKPPSDRPLAAPPVPTTPRFPTSRPFDAASSRDNLLFESNFGSNFNLPKSVLTPTSHKASPQAARSPTKARVRAKNSGLSAVKSRGNLRGEVEVQQRRAEIKRRQERLAEERGLRELLSGGTGRDVEMR